MPQVVAERTPPNGERVLSALSLILVGLVKNVVVGRRRGAGAITFHLTCFAWIVFRAASFGEAADVTMGILTLRPGTLPIE